MIKNSQHIPGRKELKLLNNYKVKISVFICVICGLILSGCNHYYPVERVIDGDTIVIERGGRSEHIRLLGIDAPEKNEPGGSESTDYISKLLAGERVYLEYDTIQTRIDRFGRTLAFVYRYRDHLFINEKMLKTSHAKIYLKYPCKYTNFWMIQFKLSS